MKKKITKTLSLVLIAASMFAVTTGFKTIEVSKTNIQGPLIHVDCGHHAPCGTYRVTDYDNWSDSYKVGTYSTGAVSWVTVYERKRTVWVHCTECQKLISKTTQRQQKTYALGFIPIEDWHNV